MKRSKEQNALIHCFFEEISAFLCDGGVRCSPGMVKELCKMTLGNTTEFLGTKISMPTGSYERLESGLSMSQKLNGIISMEEFITKIIVWAATDINLELKSPNEEKA